MLRRNEDPICSYWTCNVIMMLSWPWGLKDSKKSNRPLLRQVDTNGENLFRKLTNKRILTVRKFDPGELFQQKAWFSLKFSTFGDFGLRTKKLRVEYKGLNEIYQDKFLSENYLQNIKNVILEDIFPFFAGSQNRLYPLEIWFGKILRNAW